MQKPEIINSSNVINEVKSLKNKDNHRRTRLGYFIQKSKVLIKSSVYSLNIFVKWAFIAALTGCAGGFIGTAFHISVEEANKIREAWPWLIFAMPLGGILIVWMYSFSKMSRNHGTDDIIEAVRTDGRIPFRTAPLIFISTVITHLTGGSAGREGAALQLGGSIGFETGKFFGLDTKDMHLAVMCGMSALFAALFGTPITAVVFAIEVISVGVMYYSGLIPCMISAVTAFGITGLFGIEPTQFELRIIPNLNLETMAQVAGIAILCAGLSIIFCIMLHSSAKVLGRRVKNPYIRVLIGAGILIILTLIVNCQDYNGSGMRVIETALSGYAKPEAFVMKMIFTAVTIGAGFKGGEIVPTFFVGAAFGCLIAGLIGLDPGFGAAVGMIAMFCGMLNCPIASIILSIEMFGAEGIILFSAASVISYMLSGYFGLYHSQKIMYSKLRAEFINKSAK